MIRVAHGDPLFFSRLLAGLIDEHGGRQKDAAKLLGISGPMMSQYLKPDEDGRQRQTAKVIDLFGQLVEMEE